MRSTSTIAAPIRIRAKPRTILAGVFLSNQRVCRSRPADRRPIQPICTGYGAPKSEVAMKPTRGVVSGGRSYRNLST